MKYIFIIAIIFLVGCDRVPSNVHVISTSDCGAKWEKLAVSQTVPKHVGNMCGYNVALPNWPMAGETVFKTQFDKKVLSNTRLSYSYSIIDPVLYIGEARYLGKMGGSLEISADSVGERYEMAENIIIDKMLREVTTELTRKIEIIDANPAEIENAIFESAKDILETKGIVIADMALVIENDEQTRLAIDAVTAMRVYEAANMTTAGEQIIVARSNATKIFIGQESLKE